MESALITTPAKRNASARAAADLPLAVGPAISTASAFKGTAFVSSPFVVNVIAENAAPLATAMQSLGDIVWLAEGRAFDIAADDQSLLQRAKAIARGHRADVNLVATETRRKRLLVADMDSTIITCECLDELADMAGLKPKVAAITERAMRGDIPFAGALRERVALLKGLSLEALERVYRERVRLTSGAKVLVATMKAQGAHTLLVSGGFGFFTERVAALAGFDAQQANRLIDDGEVLTGEVAEPILGREAKLMALEYTAESWSIPLSATLAVGDGANDLDMITRAGLGVAYHAKPVVAEAAGASIAYNDLTGLLYLQGYRSDEIVDG